jgi:hypothetical protein
MEVVEVGLLEQQALLLAGQELPDHRDKVMTEEMATIALLIMVQVEVVEVVVPEWQEHLQQVATVALARHQAFQVHQ